MNTNERNEWLEKNLGIIEGTTRRFCDRYPECTYDEMFSDVIFWLINRLDGDYGDELTDISRTKLTQMVANRLNSYKRLTPSKEDPVDPCNFERIYDPDFNKNIIPWECEKYVSLTEIEKEIFFAYTFDDSVLLGDLANKYNLSVERVRQIQKKACDKVLYQLLLKHHSKALYSKYEGTAQVLINNDFYMVYVSAIIKSNDTGLSRFRICKSKVQDAIADKLNITPHDVFMNRVELKNVFISDNQNLESVNLKYDSSIVQIDRDNHKIVEAFRCDYVLKIHGYYTNEFGTRLDTTVFVRKKKYIKAKNTSRYDAISYIIDNSKLEALLLAEEKNLSDITVLSPVRTHDIETRLVELTLT